MKVYYLFFLFLIFGLIFFVTKDNPEKRQAQEARPSTVKLAKDTYRISLEIESEEDRPIADILWFRQAAQIALRHRIPWFNVLEEKISPYAVEGIIQLEADPMKAEYDANEILNLKLENE